MVVPACNPSALEGETGESEAQAQPWGRCKLEARMGYMRLYFNKRDRDGRRMEERLHNTGQLHSLHRHVTTTLDPSTGVGNVPQDNNFLIL